MGYSHGQLINHSNIARECGDVAVEVKGTNRLDLKDMKPLLAFAEEHSPRMSIIVCNEKSRRVHGKVLVLPWREFLDELWEGKIIS
jgi:hypothetical protein